MKKFLLSFFLLSLFTIHYSLFTVSAQERIESPNYRIQFPNLNSGAGIPTSSGYKLDSTVGQTVAGKFSSAGYIARAGFQYIHSIIPFSFSISDIQKNFGTLTPNTPSTNSSTIIISAGGAGGYSVKASENNPLKTSDGGDTIIDTLCDTTCSETTAGVWTSSTKYGFGFNMSGNDVPTDFTNSTYYRQFADRNSAEVESTIMSSVNVGSSRTATITYQINISAVQPAGTYRNVIKFTAIPSY
ncbi:MAG: hypothetical protein UR39_C0007G0044 [Candidatus Woesebacteria bacterium GW2011_GWA1_33_30]|uniref:Uncharacterized protein n=1 Tax=Candidatus Woesebacteria bacterium GW2011_GWA2_33_28 TaxID=1618561 RepID=A0A0G0A6J0_9BACT|nr:MAG: hypothetical protein UR38_C0007G0044 [Candidatus Woesebacteria bacterium GW2011_GWA2_33_28]KKP47826.1 MAG: hypothetical protein UR39_C0007G0044 [Candidatus Woesebacteria bacterium GW2011_GWA1_33_30]KKP49271.1 MAG: hypothetical protein UR40_C0008G0044 [Microgenomates group bacterium GW2011_GWC1_33_32]KKP51638.1 MAG: hypothetical protein UR44_C0008G0040 [Candidatus Woesebacteria bacterium GW2011_GWB1_33_38]KKP57629.1 MAG: hypothetical protein UR48_C0013G0004 [Microgenomates group bacteriu